MTPTNIPVAPRDPPCRQPLPIRPVDRSQLAANICRALGAPVRLSEFDDGDGRILIVEPLIFIPILHSTFDSLEGQLNNV